MKNRQAPLIVLLATAAIGIFLGATWPAATPDPAPAAAVTATPAPSATPIQTGTSTVWNGQTLVPCPVEGYEGPTACFWDADARSNGKGDSFIWNGATAIVISKG